MAQKLFLVIDGCNIYTTKLDENKIKTVRILSEECYKAKVPVNNDELKSFVKELLDNLGKESLKGWHITLIPSRTDEWIPSLVSILYYNDAELEIRAMDSLIPEILLKSRKIIPGGSTTVRFGTTRWHMQLSEKGKVTRLERTEESADCELSALDIPKAILSDFQFITNHHELEELHAAQNEIEQQRNVLQEQNTDLAGRLLAAEKQAAEFKKKQAEAEQKKAKRQEIERCRKILDTELYLVGFEKGEAPWKVEHGHLVSEGDLVFDTEGKPFYTIKETTARFLSFKPSGSPRIAVKSPSNGILYQVAFNKITQNKQPEYKNTSYIFGTSLCDLISNTDGLWPREHVQAKSILGIVAHPDDDPLDLLHWVVDNWDFQDELGLVKQALLGNDSSLEKE